MKRWLAIVPIAIISLFAAGFYAGSHDTLYFKINKSLEIFGSLFREISEKYVDEIDPEEFVKTGIPKMLTNLDPYTVFMGDGESDDIDALVTGSYIGFGITVGIRDSMVTITGLYDGYSAQENGVRIGDHILRIDSSYVLYSPSDEMRKYTRGEAGSKAVLQLLRGTKDTLTLTLTRQVIRLSNISYSGIISDEVGYIKIDRFSRRAAEEIRSALGNLKVGRQLNGLILDLRNNPGGLLESAVEVCEIFVPTGSRIVATKGRDSSLQKVYVSRISPSEPDLPLAILINRNSASASEVVAGAIQDLDRGIVIGERSFGKGLVQNVFPLAYNSSVKITTAKYYTPSGRCIQRVDFSKRRAGLNPEADSIRTFYTKDGRKVKELHGIDPDSTISQSAIPAFLSKLAENNSIFRFANDYSAAFTEFSQVPRSTIVKEFGKWLDNHGGLQTATLDKLDLARQSAVLENSSRSIVAKFDALEKNLRKERSKLITRYEPSIRRMLETEISKRLSTQKEYAAFSLESDSTAIAAAHIAISPKYKKILTVSEEIDSSNQ